MTGRFRLQAWRDAATREPALDERSDDLAALKARALGLMRGGAHARLDLEAWNLELNDWVRLERLEGG